MKKCKFREIVTSYILFYILNRINNIICQFYLRCVKYDTITNSTYHQQLTISLVEQNLPRVFNLSCHVMSSVEPQLIYIIHTKVAVLLFKKRNDDIRSYHHKHISHNLMPSCIFRNQKRRWCFY